MVSNVVSRVLFVCTGNLCRSPMAEGILKNLLKREGLPEISVSSAGTWACVGEGAAEEALTVCRENGVDISGHLAKQLTEENIRDSDLILVMEKVHRKRIIEMFEEAAGKTFLLSSFGSDGGDWSEAIEDPYGGSRSDYERCFTRIEQHVKGVAVLCRRKGLES